MRKIATILPRYRELNQTYSTILVRGTVRYDELCFISAFLQQFSDRQLFEAMLIAMTLEVNSEKCSVLLKSLDGEIKNNISLYEANKPFWGSIDIEHQHQITKEYSDELNLINSSLEAIGFRRWTYTHSLITRSPTSE